MEKLKMQTPDLTEQNMEKIARLFPNVITEKEDENGNIVKGIDFDLLRQELSHDLVEDDDERYRLDWPGKKASILKANTPVNKTLRPVKEESIDFEKTENLYIEGDNFEVLKILQESYLNQVKMIYIDPPYNTGKDFIYKDNFKKSREEYEEEIGLYDEEGGKLFKNTDTNGRFHSDWLSMMYERLVIARDLLKEDGVIFVSIDDNEVANLRKIMDEIFFEENSLTKAPTALIWQQAGTTAGHFAKAHEYILCYAKNKESLPFFSLQDYGDDDIIAHGALKKISKANPASSIFFPKGSIEFEGDNAVFEGEIGGSEKQIIKDKLIFKDGRLAKDVNITAGWAMKEQVLSWLNGHETFDSKGQKVIRFYFNNSGILWYEKERGTIHPKTILDKEKVGTKTGADELKKLLGGNYLENPKPTLLIKYLLSFVLKEDDLIIDFFSGSATTAHAVMQLNAEDGGHRKYIMVQLPEPTDEKGDAYKAGYKTIADIGKERIRRAGKKIKQEFLEKYQSELKKLNNKSELEFDDTLKAKKEELQKKIEHIQNLDTGFRVFKTDSSCMKDVFYHPSEISQEQLDLFISNIREDRAPEDLLTQVMLDLGLELSLPIEEKTIHGNRVFFVQHNSLVACFDESIDFGIVDEIAKINPLKVVFRDAGFKDDKDRINVETRFKRLSPETQVTVI